MIITATYLLGIIQHAWSFSILYMLMAFFMDIVLVRLLSLSPDIKIINETSDEEKQYFKEKVDYIKKKWEIEELKRKMLNKKLYG